MSKFYVVQQCTPKLDRAGSKRDIVIWPCSTETVAYAIVQALNATFPEMEASDLVFDKVLVVRPKSEIGQGFFFIWERDWEAFNKHLSTRWQFDSEAQLAKLVSDDLGWTIDMGRRWAFCYYAGQTFAFREALNEIATSVPYGLEPPSPDSETMAFFASSVGTELAATLDERLDELWDSHDDMDNQLTKCEELVAESLDTLDASDEDAARVALDLLNWQVARCVQHADSIVEAVEAASPRAHPYIVAVVNTFYLIYVARIGHLNSQHWQERKMQQEDDEVDHHKAINVLGMLTDLKENLPATDEFYGYSFQTADAYVRRVVAEGGDLIARQTAAEGTPPSLPIAAVPDSMSSQTKPVEQISDPSKSYHQDTVDSLPVGAVVKCVTGDKPAITVGALAFPISRAEALAAEALYNANEKALTNDDLINRTRTIKGATRNQGAPNLIKSIVEKHKALLRVIKLPNGIHGGGFVMMRRVS